MKVPAIFCSDCSFYIFSRARHDFRSCECGKLAIDGGFSEYSPRICYEKMRPEIIDLEISQTEQELFEDWNKGADKYGKFKKE